MTLHEEIVQILIEAEKPLSTSQISSLVNKRKNYLKKDRSEVSPFQIHGRTRNYSDLFIRNKTLVGLKSRDEKIITDLYNDNPSGGDYRSEISLMNQKIDKIESRQNLEEYNVTREEFLKEFGFTSIGIICDLQTNGYPNIIELKSPGVYAITHTASYVPTYYSQEEARANGNVIHPWVAERLEEKWVEGVDILYYGLAGASTPRSLKSRLTDLINHSKGLISDRGPHKGGEIIWQLKGYENFEVWVFATGNPPEPRDLEEKLLERFHKITGQLPFANRKF